MAFKSILIFLSVLILAACFADAQSSIGIIHVNGTLYCTTNGNITAGPGASVTPVFASKSLLHRVIINPILKMESFFLI